MQPQGLGFEVMDGPDQNTETAIRCPAQGQEKRAAAASQRSRVSMVKQVEVEVVRSRNLSSHCPHEAEADCGPPERSI